MNVSGVQLFLNNMSGQFFLVIDTTVNKAEDILYINVLFVKLVSNNFQILTINHDLIKGAKVIS